MEAKCLSMADKLKTPLGDSQSPVRCAKLLMSRLHIQPSICKGSAWSPSTQLLPHPDPGESGRDRLMRASPRSPANLVPVKGWKLSWFREVVLVWCFEDGTGGDVVMFKPGCRAGVRSRELVCHTCAHGIECRQMSWDAQRVLGMVCLWIKSYSASLISPDAASQLFNNNTGWKVGEEKH